jgi:hypothetical protein
VMALPAHRRGGTNNKAAARVVKAGCEAVGVGVEGVSDIRTKLYLS